MMHHTKNILRAFKNRTKKLLINAAQLLPISSKYIGPPKGYYASSREYWNIYKTSKSIDVTYTPFLSSSISQRKPPQSISGKNHWKFDKEYIHRNPETFVISAQNCRVIGDMGTVITHDDKLLFDVSQQMGIARNVQKVKSHSVFKYLKLPKCRQIPQTVAVLATSGGGGYFHWFTDALPRLKILRQTFPWSIEYIDKFLVNKGIPAITESLGMLNIPLDKFLIIDSQTHIQAKTFVIPSLPGNMGNPPSWACEFLRENFLKHRAEINRIPKLYISRKKAKYRRVINEENVLSCLSNCGFTPVNLEDHRLATQIALLSNAEVIVAPHGAGLTNLIWCNPGTKILEFFSPNYVNVCFWTIANQIGLEYFYLIGEGERPVEYFDPHLVCDDIHVSIEKLRLSLEMLFS